MHKIRGPFAVAATVALVLSGALGASADPLHPDTGVPEFRPINGVGSDTTQDLYNGLASVVTYNDLPVLGSHDATVPAADDMFIQTRHCGTHIPRPNGSEEGKRALLFAQLGVVFSTVRGASTADVGACGSAPWSKGPEDTTRAALQPADVQFVRSSSSATFVSGGAYSYIPLALDAVTYAIHENDTTLPRNLTIADLVRIYSASDGATVTLSTGTYSVGQSTSSQIRPFIPQDGSGTRSFWLSALGLSEFTVGSAVADSYSGIPVQQNDGSVLEDVAHAIVPFSIAQFVAQGNSANLQNDYNITVTDRRHGAELARINGVAPIIGEGLNDSFPARRPVFTVVPFASLSSNDALAAVFEGENGLAYTALNPVTQSSLVITDFGFGDLTGGVEIDGVTYNPGDTTSFRAN